MATATLPQTGTWVLDPAHTQIEVIARHMMVTKVRGAFREFTGSIRMGESPETSSVEVTMVAASVETGAADRDNHLRSPDFLDATAHPAITFTSTSVERDGTGYKVTGDLTIKGVIRPITLQMEYGGIAVDPWGNEKATFSARGIFDREAWGLSWNVALEAGGWLVSKEFKIEIEAQAVRA